MATTVTALENPNFMAPSGFRVVINRERFPNLEFFAQNVSHPGVSVQAVQAPFRSSDLFVPGDKIFFEELQITAMLDENMTLYKEIFNWLKSFVDDPMDKNQTGIYRAGDKTTYDISVLIQSSHNNTVQTVRYKDAFPMSMGNIEFTSTTGDVQYVTLPITFRYTTFTLE